MKNEDGQNAQLMSEIKDLQRQIAALSATLAFKKLENNHPALEKLVYELNRARSAVSANVAKISAFEHKHIGDMDAGKALGIFGRILCIGVLGYAISLLFGWIEREDRK